MAANLTLGELHEVIQIAVGWQHSHLHAFTVADGRRWLDEASLREGLDGEDERFATLSDVLTELTGPWDTSTTSGTAGTTRSNWSRPSPTTRTSPAPGWYAPSAGLRWRRAAASGATPSSWPPWPILWPRATPRHGVDGGHPRAEPEPAGPADVSGRTGRLSARTPTGPDWTGRLLDAGHAAVSVRPYAWLLDRVVADGLRLTSAGRLPPVVVREAAETFGWDEPRLGTALTVAARKLVDDPVGLLQHLAQRWLGMKRFGPGHDAAILFAAELAVGAHSSQEEQADAIAYGLTGLGWVDRENGFSVEPTSVPYLIADDLSLLRLLTLVPDTLFERAAPPRPAARDFALALQEG